MEAVGCAHGAAPRIVGADDIDRIAELIRELRAAGDLPGWEALLALAAQHIDQPVSMPVLVAGIGEAARRSAVESGPARWRMVVDFGGSVVDEQVPIED